VESSDDLVEVDWFSLEDMFPLGRWDVFWSSWCNTDVELCSFDIFVVEPRDYQGFQKPQGLWVG